jgi:hypothetical protein
LLLISSRVDLTCVHHGPLNSTPLTAAAFSLPWQRTTPGDLRHTQQPCLETSSVFSIRPAVQRYGVLVKIFGLIVSFDPDVKITVVISA